MRPRSTLLLMVTMAFITAFMAFLILHSFSPDLTCEKRANCCKPPKTANQPEQGVWETPVNHLIVSNN